MKISWKEREWNRGKKRRGNGVSRELGDNTSRAMIGSSKGGFYGRSVLLDPAFKLKRNPTHITYNFATRGSIIATSLYETTVINSPAWFFITHPNPTTPEPIDIAASTFSLYCTDIHLLLVASLAS